MRGHAAVSKVEQVEDLHEIDAKGLVDEVLLSALLRAEDLGRELRDSLR